MLFSSITFLTIFLPITLAATFIVRPRGRNIVLLIASLLFYTWGSGRQVWLLVAVALVAWLFGRAIVARRSCGGATTALVASATVVLLCPLLWFKYAAWFWSNLGWVVASIGVDIEPIDSRALPIGISFFTFQALSYVFDVARRRATEQRTFRDFLLYIALFPQLIAGPIVRYQTVAEQLNERVSTPDRVTLGIQRFVFGLTKKIVIADSVGSIATAAFDTPDPTTTTAWIGAIAYAIQIFFDFSGYSDMAIGLGKILGFDFPENFVRPYSAVSITDFWRRWHITLSEWFRDYVYIPLGGNRVGRPRQYANLLTVFFLTALWHGASWTFMVWGGLHAAALIAERVTGRGRVPGGRFVALARARTAVLVIVFWVFFRSATVSDALDMVTAMFSWQGATVEPALVATFTARSTPALLLGVGVFFLPREPTVLFTDYEAPSTLRAAVRPAALTGALVLCFAFISTGSLSPFLYFQF